MLITLVSDCDEFIEQIGELMNESMRTHWVQSECELNI
jgi:hypothetical protein